VALTGRGHAREVRTGHSGRFSSASEFVSLRSFNGNCNSDKQVKHLPRV